MARKKKKDSSSPRGKKGAKAGAQTPQTNGGAVPELPGDHEPTPIRVHQALEPSKPEEKAPPIAIDPPPGATATLSGNDRRVFRRVPFFRKVAYKFETLEAFKSEFANDLSLGGMFIKTDQPEAIGSVIYLEFDLKDGSHILNGYGKVVRVNPHGVPDFDAGMGIEFLKFDDNSMARIRQLITERFNG